MKIAIGTDHNGVLKKDEIITRLKSENYNIVDVSDKSVAGDDYPIYAFKLGKMIANKEADYGILLCGTGIGMSIAANKVKGIRAAHISSKEEAILAKEHNNANVITLSANSNSTDTLYELIISFLESSFKNEERHIRRNEQIMKYELGEIDV